MNDEISRRQPEIQALCERFGVVSLELFGSATSSTFDPNTSEFDFLATFANAVPDSDYGRRFLELSRALEKLLNRRIDVLTPESVTSPSFRSEIATSRQPVYAASP
jgi:uncharacterized protein